MRPFLAIFRLFLALLVLVGGAAVVLVASIIPIRIRHAPLAAWVAVGMARLCCVIFNIYVRSHNSDRLFAHAGFVFPNHLSYLDIIALTYIMPVRFLSAAEVQNYPIIGWIAQVIGTVFVHREDRSSRQRARDDIVEAIQHAPQPPIVLFPEGRLGTGDKLFPFRHGAFEIAIASNVAYLPVALHYSEPEIALWRGVDGEKLMPALWRLATFLGIVMIDVYFLEPVHPPGNADPERMAEAAAESIAEYAIHAVGNRDKQSQMVVR